MRHLEERDRLDGHDTGLKFPSRPPIHSPASENMLVIVFSADVQTVHYRIDRPEPPLTSSNQLRRVRNPARLNTVNKSLPG